MRTTMLVIAALSGSLLLAPLALGSVQAAISAPNLAHVLGTTHGGPVTLVRGGGGHMGGGHMGGGHMGGMGHMGGPVHVAGLGHMGPRLGGRGFGSVGLHRDFHRHAFFVPHHHFHHHHFFFSNVVVFGGYPYYYGDCYWLKRRALITGSRYWWARYEACLGYY